MQPIDKISKSSWALHETVKDTVANNIVLAVRSGQVAIEQSILERLLTIVSLSADEGYNKGFKSFARSVDEELKTSKPTDPEASKPAKNQNPTKKK